MIDIYNVMEYDEEKQSYEYLAHYWSMEQAEFVAKEVFKLPKYKITVSKGWGY